VVLVDGLLDSIYRVEVCIIVFSNFYAGLCFIEVSAILKAKTNGATMEPYKGKRLRLFSQI